MAVKLKYEFRGYNRVRNSLRKLASNYRKTIDGTIKDFTKEERSDLKAFGYPPQKNARQPFKTNRQRKWFFWALSTGRIEVPYPRTGKLANSWRARKSGWGNWILENSQLYAALVVGKGKQSKYHEGHWWTAEERINKDVGKLTKDLTNDLESLAE